MLGPYKRRAEIAALSVDGRQGVGFARTRQSRGTRNPGPDAYAAPVESRRYWTPAFSFAVM
jgi:hypothetical protein